MTRQQKNLMSNNMKHIELIALSCVCMAVASCSALGKYQPVGQVSDTLYGEVVGSRDTTGLAAFSWEEMFTDPILQGHIRCALENNLDLQVAGEHIAQAEAQLTGTKLAFIPTLGVTPGAQAAFSGNGLKDSAANFGVAATSSWQLSIFRLINNKKAAEVTASQMEDYRQAVRSKVIASVANTYIALLMLDSQLETVKDMQTSWMASVETVIALKDAGAADQVAVSQYQANLNAINITLMTLEKNIVSTENAMNLLLARESGCAVERGRLEEQTVPESISTGVPVLMLTLRPDIRAAQKDMELAHYATRGAVLNYFPSLSINGDAALLSPLVSIAANLTAPILNAGRNVAALREAESRQRETKLVFTRTLLEAGKEVNDACLAYTSCRKMADDHRARVLALNQAREDTEYLMLNSLEKTYLDVLYANTNYLEAKMTAISNEAQMLQSVVTLYEALGGGSI